MSRRTRRNVCKNYKVDDSDSESELNYAFDIYRRIASQTPRTRSRSDRTASKKKKSSTTSRSSRGKRNSNASTSTSKRTNRNMRNANASTSTSRRLSNPRNSTPISIDNSLCDDGEYDEQVRNRVNSHFKSTVLISDDEDEYVPPVVKPARENTGLSKSFYVVSDSDDDVFQPTSFDSNAASCSHAMQDTATTEKSPGPTEEDTTRTGNLTVSNVDELLQVVDEIIECTKSPEKPPDTVEDWKAKTEELISSADALMKDLYKITGTAPKEEPKEQSRDCPVCLESLGGSVQVATTLCGHLFCRPCITKAALVSKKCPTCRKGINNKKIVPIYV
nr:unnamed protein product [Callosobruchus analis]